MKIKLLSALILCLILSGLEKAHAQSPPVISSFAPQSAAPGTSVTITGSNFNTTTSNNIVYFGATRATVTGASATSLTVTVPAGASYGAISVLNMTSGLIGTSKEYFIPLPNRIRRTALMAADFIDQGSTPTTSTSVYHVASSDLDNDGKPDLVLTSPANINTVFIHKNTSSATSVSFANPISQATGSVSAQMIPVTGDLNADGRPDIVVAGFSSGTFTALENTGNLSFTQRNYAAGANAIAAGIGDFDSDGKLDVVVGHASGSDLKLYRNNGTPGGAISFEPSVDVAPVLAARIVVADFNGDRKPDILVAKGAGITVLENTSNLGVISFSQSSLPSPLATSLTVGDLDNDGRPDLISTYSNTGGTDLTIYRNTSAGGISFASQTVSVGHPQVDVGLGDLNGDGRVDMFVGLNTDFGGNTYRTAVLTNTSSSGAISFGSLFQLPAGVIPRSAITGDMNGDGLADLLSVNSNDGSVRIHRNALQYPPIITTISPDKGAPGTSVTLTGTGFNGTAANNAVYFGPVKATVTAASASSLTVTVPAGATHSLISILNTANVMTGSSLKKFQPVFIPNKTAIKASDIAARTTVSTVSGPYTVTSADFDSDGKPDLLVNNTNSNVTVHPNTSSSGTISFGTRVNLTANLGARHSAVGDVDGDGKLDIAVPNLASDNVSVFRNTSSGSISFAAKADFSTGTGPAVCTFADLDGDGKPELIVGNYNDDKISVLRNTTAGTTISFDPKTDFTAGTSPISISVIDANGDGKLDLVVSVSDSGVSKIIILRNTGGTGAIGFAAPVELPANTSPWTLQTGDLDGDGKPDIVANSGTDKVSVYLNTSTSGAVSFATRIDFTVGNTPRGVDLGDFNGDGRLDMIVSSEGGDNLWLFANTSSSSISFEAPITLNIPSGGPRAVRLSDLDGDGKPDITAVDGNSTTLSIFRNILVAPPAVQASSVNFSSTTATGSTIGWTPGSGASRIVWMKAGTTGTPAPSDEITYTANSVFGTGNQISSSGWYAVYKGTGSSVTVSGLTAATEYRVMVTEHNGGAGLEMYQAATATSNPAQLTTLSTDATLSALSLSAGTLSPVFASATTSYNATVTPATTSLTVTSTANQANATLAIRVNGGSYAAVTSGAASSALTLNNGSNSIDVKVTAQDGTTIQTYTITVIRQINQVITFPLTANVAYGTADFDPGATSSNTGIAVTYVSSDPAIATIVAGKVHIVKAGTVNITASQAGDGTYVAAADKVQALTINPKPLTLSLNASPAITKVYDGTTVITLAAGNYVLNGIETGDAVTVSGTAVFDNKHAGTGKTVTANSFVLAGAQKDNYTLTTVSATSTGSITAKSITLSLNAVPAITKVYNGTTAITLAAGNYLLNGIETGDAVTVSGTAAFDTKNAGTGKTVTVNSFALAGAQKDNYTLSTTTASTTGSITTKSITLSLNAVPAITKTYDGTTAAMLASGNYTLAGIETGDAVTVSGAAVFDTKHAGTGKTVTANSFVLAGAQKDNYTLTTVSATSTGSITAKNITLSLNASPAITKTYDGLTTVGLASGNYTLNGIESGDAVTVSGTASFDTKHAGTGKTVTANNFVLAGAQKDNYTLTTVSAASTGSITAKSVTLSLNATPVLTKVYDGTTAITLAAGNYLLNGIETGDAVTVSGTAGFDTKHAGTGKTVTANSFVLAGPQKDNYNLTTVSATTTGSITAKNITLSLNANPAITKTYDGLTTASLAPGNYVLNGIESGDAVNVNGVAAFADRNAGAGKLISAGGFILSGAQKDNYTLTSLTAGTSGSIEKKLLTVRADDQSKRQGDANPVFTLSYSGFVSGEGTGDLSVLPSASSTAGTASPQGAYPITPAGGSAINYSFTYIDGVLSIGPSGFVNTAPTLDAIAGRTVCYSVTPQTIALSGISAGAGDAAQNTAISVSSANNGLFSSLTVAKGPNGTAVLTFVPANAAGGSARITVTVTDDGGTANGGVDSFSQSFNLVIGSLPVALITSDTGTTVSKGSTVILTASGGTTYTWATAAGIISGQNTAALTVRPLQNTTYTVTVSSGQGCTSVQSITINVLDDYALVASNFLTPNGDGKNDTWVIKNIDAYPNNRVTVFDAAGRPVYEKKGYTNSQGWGGDVNGALLAEGSYFYVIDFGPDRGVFRGFITILKDR